MIKIFLNHMTKLVKAIFTESIAIYNGKDPAKSDLIIDKLQKDFETSITVKEN
jgi:hypothetical protein